MRAIILLILAGLAFNLHATQLPLRIEAKYDILKHGIKLAEVNEVFERNNGHYRIVSVTKSVGLLAMIEAETITYTSEGEISGQRLLPKHFTHTRKKRDDKNSRADFDWEHSELTLSNHSGIELVALPTPSQDRLSMMYQFVIQPPHQQPEVRFNMTNGKKLEDYRFQLTPATTVEVPFGKLRSNYLHTAPQQTQWKFELWLAVDHAYVPVKAILTEDDGEQLVQVLRTLNMTP